MSALKIYTFVTNKPDFIELQYSSFNKHLKERFEFIVFNNAAMGNPGSYSAITQECRRLGLQTIDIQFDRALVQRCEKLGDAPVFRGDLRYRNTNTACGYSVCWAWENIISKQDGPVCMLHHDMFLIEDVVLTAYLKNAELAFVPQDRPGVDLHLWEGFVLADVRFLPKPESINWWCGEVDGVSVDVGGQSYHYFKKHPEVRWRGFRPVHVEDNPDVDFHPSRYEYIYCENDRIMLHYRSASNWMNMSDDYHEKKTAWLRRQL